MRAATFAQQAGRAVAFSLAAFRQAFAGGKDLGDLDNVLIAAAACELHPNAVLKAIELQSTKDRLKEATAEAYERGVRGVPSVAVGDQLFWGDDRLEDAAQALGARRYGRSARSDPPLGGFSIAPVGHRVLCLPMATRDEAKADKAAKAATAPRESTPPRRSSRRGQARPPRQGDLRDRPREDDADPPLRGARGRDVREGQDRRLPAPLHRRGGHRRRRHPGAARHRLPHVDLPRARPGARPRHRSEGRHGRAVRPRDRLLEGPRRLDAPVRLGQALPRRLRHRRRQPAAQRRRRPRQRLPRAPRT